MINADFIIHGDAPTAEETARFHALWLRVRHPVTVCYCLVPTKERRDLSLLRCIESTAIVLPLRHEDEP